MTELIYLNDDLDNVIDRILHDKELSNSGLTKGKVLKTLESFQGDEIACSVFYKKYALKDNDDKIIELTLNESKDRWANAIVGAETFEAKKDFDYFRELYDYMLPAGRQMYALGNLYVPKATYTNCYVLSIDDDSIEGIYETAKNMAKTYSYGGGVGICIGKLRPKGARVSNSAKYSTGAASFMELFSNTTGVIGQSARRGAAIISIPVDHPDIEDFIEIKHNNIEKVKHANISVKITDEFMKAVIEDKDFELYFKTKHEEIKKTVKAKELWNKIIKSAHNSAEPGVLFWTHAQEMSPSDTYAELKIHTTNPCLSGETQVNVADGRGKVSFAQLEKEKKDVLVYCLDDNLNITTRMMRSPRVTGFTELYKITFENNCSFKATDNHKFMTNDGTYRKVKNLAAGNLIKCFIGEEETICKIISVECVGTDIVYNGTVDDFHNYLVVGEKNEQFRIVSRNCGEQFLEAGNGQGLSGNCNLASILLDRFVSNPFTENAKFDFNLFKDIVSRGVRHLDNIIELNDGRHALEGQNKAAKLGRRLGLGFTGLADTFAALGLAYDSDEAFQITEEIMKVKMEAEYNASIDLAIERGSFPLYDANKHFERGFCKYLPEYIKERAKQYGLRNVAISTIAPSGSISIMAQCSSGIEPIFALKYKRYTQLGVDERKEFTIYHQALARYFNINNTKDVPDYWKASHQIDYSYRIKLQGLLQKYIDASISSTINLPADVSVETVGQIYIDAWREGLKGITVYREGSREGILVTDEFAKRAGVPEMDSVTYRVKAEGGDKFYIIVSYKNKNIKDPYQVFVMNYKQGDQDTFVRIGNSLVKMLKGKGISEERIQKYSNRSKTSLEKLTRFLSLSMKTNCLAEAVEILNEHAFVGTLAMKLYEIFSKSIDAKKGLCKNPDCKSSNVRMEEGCMHCLDCGWSGCN